MSPMKNSVRGLVGAASILVVGIVIGIAAHHTVLIHGEDGRHMLPVAIGSAAEHDAVLGDMTERLSLTRDQAARIHRIIISRQASVDTAWTAIRAHLQQATARTIAEIEAELDARQRDLLRVMVLERHGELPAVDSVSR